VSIWRPGSTTSPAVYDQPVDEFTFDEMQAVVPTEDAPTKWAKVRVDDSIDVVPH
jgi:hypothetical protein